MRELVDRLRRRSDLTVGEQNGAWQIRIPKAPDFVCEVTIPIDWCFEWFAGVRIAGQKDHVWYDWMDHYGSPDGVLDAEMAECIGDFVERVTRSDLKLPLRIHEAKDRLVPDPTSGLVPGRRAP